jgi:FkbM family methyltransferase
MYESEITVRHDTIDRVSQWYWYSIDTGAWDGPKHDWITSHKEKYFTHVKKFDTVVQAGGCLGMYPRLLSDIFGKVYTFEPDSKNFYCLNLNCQKSNIIKFNCALGEGHKMVSINRRKEDNLGMHCIREDDEEMIPMLCIDDLNLQICDMICLDVECYESNILLGAMETISRFKPVITCENGNATIHTILRQFGYEHVDQSVNDAIYAIKE